MAGLFDNQASEPIAIAGEDITLIHHADLGRPYDDLFDELLRETPWRSENITLFGKTMPQPRLMAWYGDPEATYTYSRLELRPLPWTETLTRLRQGLEAVADSPFNSVLLNYYRDEHDSMGFHSDDEPELGPQPVIASLSLGAARPFILQPKVAGDQKPLKVLLGDGSLLIMRGHSQRDWKHGIRKQKTPCGPRINLTFRRILPR